MSRIKKRRKRPTVTRFNRIPQIKTDGRQEEDALEGGNIRAVPQNPFIMLVMKMMEDKSDIKIDFEGIQDRVFGFRIFPYYYHSIRRLATQLLFEMGSDDHDRFLLSFDPTKGKVQLLNSGFEEYQISENGQLHSELAITSVLRLQVRLLS